ncbi:MAG: hypothetical protein ACPGID_06380 [Rubricella sp.]
MTGDIARIETVSIHLEDWESGWADICVTAGPTFGSCYAFSLVWGDHFSEIEGFEEALVEGRPARIHLRGEPGAVEITATPAAPEGWARMEIWLIEHAGQRTRDHVFLCRVAPLAAQMRADIPFLAKKYAKATKRMGLLGRVAARLTRRTGG